MRRKFVQLAALLLVLCLLAGGAAVPSAASGAALDDRVIRVGLAYSGYQSRTIDGANLANDTGHGFRLGYFDDSNRFVQLGTTAKEKISVVETVNVGYGTSGGYTSYHASLAGSASVVVGEYHLQLPDSYATFDEAQAAAAAYEGGFPAYIGGTFRARIANCASREEAQAVQERFAGEGVETGIVGTTAYGVSVVITGTDTILFQYDDKGSGTGLGIMPNAAGGDEDFVTLFNTEAFGRDNNRWYGGFRYERVGGGNLTVVNMVKLGDYLKGVVPIEVSSSWPIEAQKAQAVAARTYALANLNAHRSAHFDLCPSTDCQAYSGLARAAANSDRAVEETAGVTVKYNGTYASCNYYSSNGGASMSAKDVWGTNYPYLLGKADPYEASINVNNYWTFSCSFRELTSKLNLSSTAAGARITEYTDGGNPLTIAFYGADGRLLASKTTAQLVRALGLKSYHYELGLSGGSSSGSSGSGGGLAVNGSQTLSGLDGLYAVDGNGDAFVLPEDVWVITGDGTSTAESWSGSSGGQDSGLYTGTNGIFVISGRGAGHNVGMSQWGAYAMAGQGFTYDQILKFYYTGVTVG